jgi:hypothetical protein
MIRTVGRAADAVRATEHRYQESRMLTELDRTDTDSHRRSGAARTWDYPRVTAAAVGVFLVVSGLWAMVGPRSFFDAVAAFEPYNQHLIQDIGAFQLGLGAVLLLVLVVRDALVAALVGVGIASAAHVVSHAVGHDLGGTPELDIPFFSIITVLLLTAGMVRQRRSPT